jgi:hypothetical protein
LRASVVSIIVVIALLTMLSRYRVGGAPSAPKPTSTASQPDARIGEATTCVREPYPHATCTIYDPTTGTTRTTVLP